MTTETEDHMACVVCRESIQAGARICIHCKNAQNWSRHIFQWAAVFTALLALLPLWSGTLALRELAFPDHKADVKAHTITCSKDGVGLAVTNEGDRPGIVTGFSLKILVDNQLLAEDYILVPRGEEKLMQRVVPPGQTIAFDLGYSPENVPTPLPVPDKSKACELLITTRVEAFNRGDSSSVVRCACDASRVSGSQS